MYPAFQMTTMWSSTRDPQSSTSRRIQVSFWASAQLAAVAEERIRRHRLRDGRWHSGATSHIALFFGFSNSRYRSWLQRSLTSLRSSPLQMESATAGFVAVRMKVAGNGRRATRICPTDEESAGLAGGENCISDLAGVEDVWSRTPLRGEARRCSPTRTRRERGADVRGPKSGVRGLSFSVREGITRTKVVLRPRVFWPWFFRRVRPSPSLRGRQVPGTRRTGKGSVAVRLRPLPVLGAPVSLLWRVSWAGPSLAGRVVLASACVAPRLRFWVPRWFSLPGGLRSSVSLPRSPRGFGCPRGACLCRLHRFRQVWSVGRFAAFSVLHLLSVVSIVFILAGIPGVFIALRSSRSRRLLR